MNTSNFYRTINNIYWEKRKYIETVEPQKFSIETLFKKVPTYNLFDYLYVGGFSVTFEEASLNTHSYITLELEDKNVNVFKKPFICIDGHTTYYDSDKEMIDALSVIKSRMKECGNKIYK